jgi:ATP-dependent Clp protease ATP-binding subunit ClpC
MFERFTDKGRHVVVLAQEEARALQHNYIGTEHLLLGLLGEPDSIGGRALARFDLSLPAAREEVLARIGPGPMRLDGHIPFTPRAKKVLELALREALALKHNYIGTEHVLLGLVGEGEGVGALIVAAHAPEPAAVRVRMAVLDLLPTAPVEPGRRWLRPRSRPSRDDRTEPAELDTTLAADTTLREASRLAGADPVGSQHLLLAALADPDSAAARVLITLGVDLEQAKVALRAVDITGTSDESPEDAGRRNMRIRTSDTQVTIEVTDPALVERARAALDALADDSDTIRGDLAVSVSLGSVWRALYDSLDDIRRRAARSVDPQPAPTTDPAAANRDGTADADSHL